VPLTITFTVHEFIPIQRVALADLQTRAQSAHNPHAGRRDIVGLTSPRIAVDQHGLNYHRETVAPAQESFRFTGGTLSLALHQTVQLLATLNAVEVEVWLAHEMLHVSDNAAIFRQTLEPALRADTSIFLPLFEHQQWLPVEAFATLEDSITLAVESVFRGLTRRAANLRDTPAEYRTRVAMARGSSGAPAARTERSRARR
jgi:hypothetical protein